MRPPFRLLVPIFWALLATASWPAGQAAAESSGDGADSAVVLMYHRFGEDAYPSTSIRMVQFRAHLDALSRPPYTVLPVPRIVAALAGRQPLPGRPVGITIDDAYRSVYTQAWPLLKAAGLPFTIFVASEGVDRGYRDLMSWAQLRELAASGLVTLGNHSASHPHMAAARYSHNRAELEKAARRIEEETGQRPTLLAYPYGEVSRELRRLAEEMRFAAGFGQQSGAAGAGADLLVLPRFALNEHYGALERFRLAIDALPLPVHDAIPQDWLLSAQGNPPLFGITVEESAGALDRLVCYVSGQGPLALKRIGARRVEGRPAKPLPQGRSRINCTLPGPAGRWRWYGTQFYLSGS